MANSKITNLPSLTAAPGDEIPVNRAGADGKITVSGIAREKIAADRNYYVNVSTGSDSNTGLGSGTAFATIQKAINTVCDTLDLQNYNVVINVAAGTYPEEVFLKNYVGGEDRTNTSGQVHSPYVEVQDIYNNAAVRILGTSGAIISGVADSTGRLVHCNQQSPWFIKDMEFVPNDGQDAFQVGMNSNTMIGDTVFGTGIGYCIYGARRGTFEIQEQCQITFSGGTYAAFIYGADGCRIRSWEHLYISFSGDSSFGDAFISAGENSQVMLRRVESISLNAHAVTGWKWYTWHGGQLVITTNSGTTETAIVDLNSYLPGSTNGTAYHYSDANALRFGRGMRLGATASPTTMPGTGQLIIAGGTVTDPQTILDLTQTWNDAADTFTGVKLNVTNTNSAAASKLIDLQVGGSALFSVTAAGALQLSANSSGFLHYGIISNDGQDIRFSGSGSDYFSCLRFPNMTSAPGTVLRLLSTTLLTWGTDTSAITNDGDLGIGRKAAANLRFGAADAAAPVAQTISVQNVVAGTSNIAGQNFTVTGSIGTGTGAGGQIILQTAPAGGSGTSQNALATGLTITAPAVNMQPSVVVGNQALATTATDGFLYIPSCAGAPSGVPTAFAGRTAVVYDSTNNQIYVYNGAWKKTVALT